MCHVLRRSASNSWPANRSRWPVVRAIGSASSRRRSACGVLRKWLPGLVELEHADGVTAHDLVGLLVGRTFEHLLAVRLRVRPCGVGVRVVGLETDLVFADLVERSNA